MLVMNRRLRQGARSRQISSNVEEFYQSFLTFSQMAVIAGHVWKCLNEFFVDVDFLLVFRLGFSGPAGIGEQVTKFVVRRSQILPKVGQELRIRRELLQAGQRITENLLGLDKAIVGAEKSTALGGHGS